MAWSMWSEAAHPLVSRKAKGRERSEDRKKRRGMGEERGGKNGVREERTEERRKGKRVGIEMPESFKGTLTSNHILPAEVSITSL